MTRGKEVLKSEVCGVYTEIIDAVDALYNHSWSRWYVREPIDDQEEEAGS